MTVIGRLKSQEVKTFEKFGRFLAKQPLTVIFAKFCSESFHCDTDRVAWWLSGRACRWTCDLHVAGSIPGGPHSRNIDQLSLASLRSR